eukprot:4292747-Karenia_brevis.AAC.1
MITILGNNGNQFGTPNVAPRCPPHGVHFGPNSAPRRLPFRADASARIFAVASDADDGSNVT